MTVEVPQGKVAVRMYNVGFGDAFMIVFPDQPRPRTVLVDCGTHSAGPGPVGIKEVARRIVEDVTVDGVARIDVIVGTHRHQDHVSGFANPIWDQVQVSEVWMPWTEHPRNAKAKRIRERQSGIAQRLELALSLAGASESPAYALAVNALKNEKAMRTLHEGFSGVQTRRFLPEPQRQKNSFTTDALPGVRIHVMGPSRDERVIREMDPPAGESYLRLLDQELTEDEPKQPFDERWHVAPEAFSSSFAHLDMPRGHKRKLDELSSVDHFQLAVALENAINGTSLMLMFEYGDALLLFPGDAQWGTWQAALADEQWRALLAQTSFYKVGHHGSHNATPRDFVEEALGERRESAPLDDFSAMVSTRHIEMWKYIPKTELLDALRETSPRLARSDVVEHAEGFSYSEDELVVETLVPTERG